MEKVARLEGQDLRPLQALTSRRQGTRARDLGLPVGGEAALSLASTVASF